MVILPGIRVIVRRFLCIERRFLSDWSKRFYVDVLAQCALVIRSRDTLNFLYFKIWFFALICSIKYVHLNQRHT